MATETKSVQETDADTAGESQPRHGDGDPHGASG